jgi:hypothetical protein
MWLVVFLLFCFSFSFARVSVVVAPTLDIPQVSNDEVIYYLEYLLQKSSQFDDTLTMLERMWANSPDVEHTALDNFRARKQAFESALNSAKSAVRAYEDYLQNPSASLQVPRDTQSAIRNLVIRISETKQSMELLEPALAQLYPDLFYVQRSMNETRAFNTLLTRLLARTSDISALAFRFLSIWMNPLLDFEQVNLTEDQILRLRRLLYLQVKQLRGFIDLLPALDFSGLPFPDTFIPPSLLQPCASGQFGCFGFRSDCLYDSMGNLVYANYAIFPLSSPSSVCYACTSFTSCVSVISSDGSCTSPLLASIFGIDFGSSPKLVAHFYKAMVFGALLRTVYFPFYPLPIGSNLGMVCETCGGPKNVDLVGCSNLPPTIGNLSSAANPDGSACYVSDGVVHCKIHPCTHTKVLQNNYKVITNDCFGLIAVPFSTVYDCSIDIQCFLEFQNVPDPYVRFDLPVPDFGSPPFPADVVEYQRIQQAVGDDVADLARWGETVKKLRTKEQVVPLPEIQTRPYIEVSPDTLPELSPAPDTLIDPSISVSPTPIPIPLPPDLDTDPYVDVSLDLSPQELIPYVSYLLTQEAVQPVALINQIEKSLDLDNDCQTQEQMLYANFEGMKDLLVQSFVGLALIFGFISAILVSMSIFELWKNIPIRRV